jgi:hypothetical protein
MLSVSIALRLKFRISRSPFTWMVMAVFNVNGHDATEGFSCTDIKIVVSVPPHIVLIRA